MDIWIKIRSLFDSKGTQDAAAGLNKLSAGEKSVAQGANEAAESHGKLSNAGMAAAHMFHGLEAAAQGSARGMFSAATGAKHLLESIGAAALTPIMAAIAGIGIAVAMVVKHFKAVAAETAKLKEESIKLDEETKKFRELRMDRAIEEYDHLAKKIRAAATEQDNLNAAKMKLEDARTATKIAKLDLEEQQALAKLAPEDAEGRKATQFTFATRRQQVTEDAEVTRSAEESLAAQQKVAVGAHALFVEHQALAKVEDELAKATKERANITTASNKLLAATAELETIKNERSSDMAKTAALSVLPIPGAAQIAAANYALREQDRSARAGVLTPQVEQMQDYLKEHKVEDVDTKIHEVTKKRDDRREAAHAANAALENDTYASYTADEHQQTVAAKVSVDKAKLDDEIHAFNNQVLAARQKKVMDDLQQSQQTESMANAAVNSDAARATTGGYSQQQQLNDQSSLAAAQENTRLLQSLLSDINKEFSRQNAILKDHAVSQQ